VSEVIPELPCEYGYEMSTKQSIQRSKPYLDQQNDSVPSVNITMHCNLNLIAGVQNEAERFRRLIDDVNWIGETTQRKCLIGASARH